MVLNGLRITTDWFGDATRGVNAQIDRLPLDGNDPRPKHIRKILDVTKDPGVLSGDFGRTFPALVGAPEDPAVMKGEINQVYRDGESMSFSWLYVSGDADRAQAVRDGLYTCRAMEQSIAHLMDVGNVASRTRNGIILQSCIAITYGTVIEEAAEGWITAAFTAEFQPRNITPKP